MSFTKMVRLFCDGPNCRREVYGETADDARRIAKNFNGWTKVRKFGFDYCSLDCERNHIQSIRYAKSQATKVAEVPAGTLDTATVHHT